MVKILLVVGRSVDETAIENLRLLNVLAKTTPEFDFLHSDSLWSMLNFNKDQNREITDTCGFYINATLVFKLKFIESSIISKTKFIHPNSSKLSKRSFKHMCNIFNKVETSNLVVAANGSGKGRPAFALVAARSLFIPNLNLSSSKTTEKLKGLERRIDGLTDVGRDSLISYLEQFKAKYSIEFQLNESIKTMGRQEIIKHIKKVKQLL